jgi:predicted nuclease of predicted toxin-antitoxin system
LSFRFQADADLNPEIGRGLRRREPSIDFRAAAGVIAEGAPDSEVLQIAADDRRVLVSRDITTMPDHFARFVAQHESPGILLIPSRRSIGSVIEGLFVVWLTWTPDDLRNQARWLP